MSDDQRNYQFRGDLRDKALPEILYSVERFQVPGVLEAEYAGILKKIFVKDGCVVHASSTDLNDSLGAYLYRSGRLTPEQFQTTMKARRESDRQYGAMLVEESHVSPGEVLDAIRQQVEAIVWSLFYWDQGEVRFRLGEFTAPSAAPIQLPMQLVILEGIRRAPNAKALVRRLGPKESIFEPAFKTEDLIRMALNAGEYQLLQMVDGRRSLYEICVHGPLSTSQNAKLMYAFNVLRLIEAKDGETATTEVPAAGEGETPKDKTPPTTGIKIRLKTTGDRFSE